MQTGKILPVFRQFFESIKTADSNRDKDPQQGQGQPGERDATEEEARRAAEILLDSEEFKRNNLKVTAGSENSKPALFVSNGDNALLRVIKGAGIIQILLTFGSPDSPRQGRILDRRI